MKAASTQVQTAYYSLLNGNVNVNGVIPVYDVVPDNASHPYIQLREWTEVDDSSKSDFGDRATFSISIVDRFDGSYGTSANIYAIWDAVKQIIRARPTGFSMADFDMISTTVGSVVEREEKTQTHLYKILECRFNHLVAQK